MENVSPPSNFIGCPYCFGLIDPRATKCCHCASDLPLLVVNQGAYGEQLLTIVGFLGILFGASYMMGLLANILLHSYVFTPLYSGVLAVSLGVGVYSASRFNPPKWLLYLAMVLVGLGGGYWGILATGAASDSQIITASAIVYGGFAGLALAISRGYGASFLARALSYLVSLPLFAAFSGMLKTAAIEYYLNSVVLYSGGSKLSPWEILSAFQIQPIIVSGGEALVAGFFFGLSFLVAEKILAEERSYTQLIKSVLFCALVGGLYGGVMDAFQYNAYWSGIFNGADNIFINAYEGFKRDAIFCGFVAFGAMLAMVLLYRLVLSKWARVLLVSIGGGIGGALGVYTVVNSQVVANSNSAIGEAYEGLLDTFLARPDNTVYLAGGVLAATICLFFAIFQVYNLHKFGVERNMWNLLGGLLGGVLSGGGIGFLAASTKYESPVVLAGATIIFGVMLGIYGMIIGVGLDFNINRPPPAALGLPAAKRLSLAEAQQTLLGGADAADADIGGDSPLLGSGT